MSTPPAPESKVNCDLVNNYAWDVKVAYAVCMAESDGNPNALNMNDRHNGCVGSFSLMQVACFWYTHFGYSEKDYYDPNINIRIAYLIYKRQNGFNAWSAYTNGSYTIYL